MFEDNDNIPRPSVLLMILLAASLTSILAIVFIIGEELFISKSAIDGYTKVLCLVALFLLISLISYFSFKKEEKAYKSNWKESIEEQIEKIEKLSDEEVRESVKRAMNIAHGSTEIDKNNQQ